MSGDTGDIETKICRQKINARATFLSVKKVIRQQVN